VIAEKPDEGLSLKAGAATALALNPRDIETTSATRAIHAPNLFIQGLRQDKAKLEHYATIPSNRQISARENDDRDI
jgi:hypothetical protein